MEDQKKTPVPRWLEDLQQKSWEPEILLSGIVLYGMFKVPELLDSFLAYFKLNIFGNSTDIDNLVALSKMGIYWLITGLIMHLICRGIWIGMVGLSYAFPEGIRADKLDYQSPFREKVSRIASYERIVIRLEKISSVLFSLSFMLFMSLLGGYLYFLIMLILPFLFTWIVFDMDFEGIGFQVFQVWVFLVLGVGIFGLIDFVSLGYFRKFKWVAKLYWPLHRFISTLTLSRFYRPIYYGMVTHVNKWALFFLLILFTFISIVGAGNMTDGIYVGDNFSRISFWDSSQGYSAFSGYYDDQNEDYPSVRAHIPSDIINGDVLRLFVVANIRYEDNIEKNFPRDSLKELYPDTSSAALNNMAVASFFQVRLNGKKMDSLKWLFHYKNHLDQRGYLTYISLEYLKEGLHEVSVYGPGEQYKNPFATIPFYRDVQVQNQPRKTNTWDEKDGAPDFQPKPFGVRE